MGNNLFLPGNCDYIIPFLLCSRMLPDLVPGTLQEFSDFPGCFSRATIITQIFTEVVKEE